MNQVVTSIDLFTDVDAIHPFASMRRVGGGRWQAFLYGDDPRTREEQSEYNATEETINGFAPGTRMPGFKDSETCLAWCEQIASMVTADPSLVTPLAVHLRAENAALRDELEALRSKEG